MKKYVEAKALKVDERKDEKTGTISYRVVLEVVDIPYHLLTDQKQDLSKEQGFDNVYGRLSFNEPAPTITTAFSSITRGRFAHPKEHRAITAREASRLQSVPDWFEFLGNNTEVARQVGNGVPVLLAKAIGAELIKLLSK